MNIVEKHPILSQIITVSLLVVLALACANYQNKPIDYCPDGDLVPIGAKIIGEDKGEVIIFKRKTVYACIREADIVAPVPPSKKKTRKDLNQL